MPTVTYTLRGAWGLWRLWAVVAVPGGSQLDARMPNQHLCDCGDKMCSDGHAPPNYRHEHVAVRGQGRRQRVAPQRPLPLPAPPAAPAAPLNGTLDPCATKRASTGRSSLPVCIITLYICFPLFGLQSISHLTCWWAVPVVPKETGIGLLGGAAVERAACFPSLRLLYDAPSRFWRSAVRTSCGVTWCVAAVLQRTSVNKVQVKMQGIATCLFLCMDACGLLYGSVRTQLRGTGSEETKPRKTTTRRRRRVRRASFPAPMRRYIPVGTSARRTNAFTNWGRPSAASRRPKRPERSTRRRQPLQWGSCGEPSRPGRGPLGDTMCYNV